MEYSYLHERQAEHRSNPEASQTHHQSQHPVHYQHQQYATPHHTLPAGYPGLRFASYINPIQGPGSGPGSGPSQVPSAEGLPPSRVVTSSASNSSTGGSHQGGHEFERVLSTVMQGSSAPLPYRSVLPNNQHVLPLNQVSISSATVATPPPPPHQLQPSDTTPEATYQIQDLSNSTQTRMSVPNSSLNVAGGNGNTPGGNTTSVRSSQHHPKKKVTNASPRSKPKKTAMSEPIIQVVEPQAQRPRSKDLVPLLSSTGCQTDPLFEVPRASNRSFEAAPDLPEGLCFMQSLEGGMRIMGVIALNDIEAGVEYGPFTGDFAKEGLGCFDPSTWEICVRGQTWLYIDGALDSNNWLHHIQVARWEEEQNMEAFQVYGDIFFRTMTPIKSGTELRVFYSKDYSSHVGFKHSLDELAFDRESQIFECNNCQCRYTNPKSLLRHIVFEHEREHKTPVKEKEVPLAREEKTARCPNRTNEYANLINMREIEARKALEQKKEEERAKAREKAKGDKAKRFMKVKLVPLKTATEVTVRARSAKQRTINKFFCKKCGKSFPTQGHLREHCAFHQETRNLKPICSVCGLECKHSRALKQHQLSHDSEAFQCQYCKKYFRRKGCLVYHLRNDHKIFVGEKWMRGNLVDQMARYVGPGEPEEEPFHPELPKDMLGKRILVTAKRPKVFKCNYCPKKFRAHHLVLKHEKLVHMRSGRYQCEYCTKVFMEEYRYTLHKRSHTKDRPFKCSECQLSFASESALANHQPEHRGERPFKCDICGKAFRTRKYATTHKRRQHTAPSILLQCKFCDKTFKDKTGLVRHERCHKGIRPHVCLTCGKAFGTKYTLQSHLHIHTGEKKFTCKVCGQKFGLNHHLTTHMIRHQKPKPADLVIAVMQRDAAAASVFQNSEGASQESDSQGSETGIGKS